MVEHQSNSDMVMLGSLASAMLELVAQLEGVTKHLPGQHDQSTHGRRGTRATKWSSNLTDQEVFAIRRYAGSSTSWDVNAALRQQPLRLGHALRGTIIDITDNLTTALDKASFPEGTTVYRVVGRKFPKLIVGDVFLDRGFVSTSKSQSWIANYGARYVPGKNDRILKIRIRKGAKAARLSPLVPDEEHEILIQRGSRFKVVGMSNNQYELELIS